MNVELYIENVTTLLGFLVTFSAVAWFAAARIRSGVTSKPTLAEVLDLVVLVSQAIVSLSMVGLVALSLVRLLLDIGEAWQAWLMAVLCALGALVSGILGVRTLKRLWGGVE